MINAREKKQPPSLIACILFYERYEGSRTPTNIKKPAHSPGFGERSSDFLHLSPSLSRKVIVIRYVVTERRCILRYTTDFEVIRFNYPCIFTTLRFENIRIRF